MNSPKIIAVDLDGTLTWTDTLHESILGLVHKKPFILFLLPFWLIKGIAHLKLKVADNFILDVSTLPYNLPFIDWLREQRANGKKIILCSAANERVAHAVSKHLDLFDDVIASDANTNMKSIIKRNSLEERFGFKKYDYAGNSKADIEVWAGARRAILVNTSDSVNKKAKQVISISRTFSSESVMFSDWIKALRIHQWLKNLLLFIPLLAAHQVGNVQSLYVLLIAFISFSLCASSIYITNDLLDLESDRQHPQKKYRPFASAKLPITIGVAIALLLICLGIKLGMMVGTDFLNMLFLYILIAFAYSFVLKRLIFFDCFTLASLYTIRIIAGGAAVSLTPSFWLLGFSIFIFLSLAFVKRYVELLVLEKDFKSVAQGRGYKVSDAGLLVKLGISFGYISTLFVALYMQSENVVSLYEEPIAIWLLIPILLFWVSWLWLKAQRGEMQDDPIIFVLKDMVSLLVTGLIFVILVYAANGI